MELTVTLREPPPSNRITKVDVQLNAKDSAEQVAAILVQTAARPAALVSNLRSEQTFGILKKLAGRHIAARPMSLQEGARSDFADCELVLIIPDVGSHAEIDAVVAAAKRAEVEHRIISRKSSAWDEELCEQKSYQPMMQKLMHASDAVMMHQVQKLKENGHDARVLSLLTDGVKEYVFLAAAAKVLRVEMVAGERIDKLTDELQRAQKALAAARHDDEAARVLLGEAERDLATVRGELAATQEQCVEQEQQISSLHARIDECTSKHGPLVKSLSESCTTLLDEKKALEERVADLERAATSPSEVVRLPMSLTSNLHAQADDSALRKAVLAAVPAVESGLMDAGQALTRIADIAKVPS